MLKHIAFFTGGVLATVVALIVYARLSAARTINALATTAGPVAATVTIRVLHDPQALSPVKDASELLDRLTGLADTEKQKIRDALASGLVSEIRVEGNVGGESRWITVPATSSGLLIRGSSKVTFGPSELKVESTRKPNKALEPTPTAVTSPAAQEPRQP
jgi:hypothetical protein